LNFDGIDSSTHFVNRLKDEKRREWFVHVNDGIRSTFGATWSGSRTEIVMWVLESDGERDDSDSYWNISRLEERAGKKLERKNLCESRRFSQQQDLLLVSIVVGCV
jgi:hypothetical protein